MTTKNSVHLSLFKFYSQFDTHQYFINSLNIHL